MASIGTHEIPETGSARTVCGHEAMTLSAREREIFVAALLKPPAPGGACARRRSATSGEPPNRCRRHHAAPCVAVAANA